MSIRRSVRPSVHPSVREHESKSGKTSVLKVFVFVSVLERVFGVDGGWSPLTTRPQRFCDPASLVPVLFDLEFLNMLIAVDCVPLRCLPRDSRWLLPPNYNYCPILHNHERSREFDGFKGESMAVYRVMNFTS